MSIPKLAFNTVVEGFKHYALDQPEATAVICSGNSVTYRQLDQESNRLATALLLALPISIDSIGLMMDRSIDLVVAMMGILKTGASYLPLDPALPSERVNTIMEDAGLNYIITDEKYRELMDSVDDFQNEQVPFSPVRPDQVAYVIYTSGSTGKPKGIMIEHHALKQFMTGFKEEVNLVDHSKMLALATISFDASILEILVPLGFGFTVVMANQSEQQDPHLLNQLLMRHSVDLINITPTRMQQILSAKATEGLRHVRKIFFAGEPLSVSLLQKTRRVTCATLYNLYGPTETTVSITAKDVTDADHITIGQPIRGVEFYVDERNELYISGETLARGYLNDSARTEENFIVSKALKGKRLYKTGDLVRRLPNGDYEYIGRVDNQVKVNGYRVELEEIEKQLLDFPGMDEAVVTVDEREEGLKVLCAYIQCVQHPTRIALYQHLENKLPQYMIPREFYVLDQLPLTPNGKVDRKAVKQLEEARLLTSDALQLPVSPTEQQLSSIWSTILGVSTIDRNEDFFHLGGQSLLATKVMQEVNHIFHGKYSIGDLFKNPTIAKLAAVIEEGSEVRVDRPVWQLTEREYKDDDSSLKPLSLFQHRLWITDKLYEDSPSYNVVTVWRIKAGCDPEILEQSLQEIVQRHESLRTVFMESEGIPVQRVMPSLAVPLRVMKRPEVEKEKREQTISEVAEELRKERFSLEEGPLIRAHILQFGTEDQALIVTMHHIISDDWSMGVLIGEWTAIYEEKFFKKQADLPDLPIQYGDFSVWQNHLKNEERMKKEESYWKKKLAGPLPTLDLPLDSPRPPRFTHLADSEVIYLNESITNDLYRVAKKYEITLFMLFITAYKVLLHTKTHQEDILVGSPIASRKQKGTENLIGFFVNTLVLRTSLSGDPTISDLLYRVRQTALEAYDHQDLPFDQLVEVVKPKRDLRYPLLIQAWLVFQHIPQAVKTNGIEFQLMPLEVDTTNFDLSMSVVELDKRLRVSLTYNKDLFQSETISKWMSQFEQILTLLIHEPDKRLSAIGKQFSSQQRNEWKKKKKKLQFKKGL
ncbi:amino acid adenylation domain-containing protein [Marininema mesophilum]|uniref:Amino acid adenylation domain-containing protein n=1 Tax=Marininema mesophilum TaxID=1048340 RepID=A0A1H3ATQ2_9BACL|nr:non-ribosomal peptide synthetase [Marininema mesophilum]SDX33066.1 amino acid adenylation domain-containing protein [Marininema mesophilum]